MVSLAFVFTMECKLDKCYDSNLCKYSSDRKSFLSMVKYCNHVWAVAMTKEAISEQGVENWILVYLSKTAETIASLEDVCLYGNCVSEGRYIATLPAT